MHSFREIPSGRDARTDAFDPEHREKVGRGPTQDDAHAACLHLIDEARETFRLPQDRSLRIPEIDDDLGDAGRVGLPAEPRNVSRRRTLQEAGVQIPDCGLPAIVHENRDFTGGHRCERRKRCVVQGCHAPGPLFVREPPVP